MNGVWWVAFSVCATLPSPAQAQNTTQTERLVLVGGLSFGVGDTRFTPDGFVVVGAGLAGPLAVADHERGLASVAFVGLAVTRRVAIVFDTDFSGAGASGFSSRVMTVGARYRPASRIWFEGGAGLGSLRYQPGSQSEDLHLGQGLGLSAATGIEVVRWKLFALDLHARVSTATYGQLRVTRAAIQLGYEVWLPLR